ncbi:MAG: fluoride efflux transporter CrcB [Euryarchaeota archaeon]|nr:fluoride efflux transporter CrcB [Euryarchaeota archaeon]
MNADASINDILIVGTGGFLGAIARYQTVSLITSPLGTLCVNVIGSFLLAVMMYDTEYLGFVPSRSRMALGIGFLGSYTTFSTFAMETSQMFTFTAALNIVANVGLTLIAVFLGRGFIIYLSRMGR